MTGVQGAIALAPDRQRRNRPNRPATRGRVQSPLWRIGGTLDVRWRIGLGAAGVLGLLAAWQAGAAAIANPSVVPTPTATASALAALAEDGTLLDGLRSSTQRIAIGFGISSLIGVVVGIAIGTFVSVEGFFEAQIAFLRYIPASALTPVFLLWFGIGESPKVWLIVVGTVFFNILMMADVARSVPRELVNAAYTLGAGRLTVLRRVVLRHGGGPRPASAWSGDVGCLLVGVAGEPLPGRAGANRRIEPCRIASS